VLGIFVPWIYCDSKVACIPIFFGKIVQYWNPTPILYTFVV
jgi:hypothetical protein